MGEAYSPIGFRKAYVISEMKLHYNLITNNLCDFDREVNDIAPRFHEVSYKRRLWPRASSLIGKETLKKANVECRRNVFCLFKKD